jgi:hypothetical protein
MGVASYEVVPNKDAWAIREEGKVGGSYATKEAAFEAVAMAASNAIKEGHEVRISIPGGSGGPALG